MEQREENIQHDPRLHKKALGINTKELVMNAVWLVIILFLIYVSVRFIGIDNMKEKVMAAGIFGPLLLIFLKASTLVFAPLGGSPLYPVAGALFGFTKGFIYVFLGDVLGSVMSFYISRIFGRKIASYFLSKPGMHAADDILRHIGTTKGFIQARLIFIGFPEAINYGAGLTTISFWKFITISILIGAIPIAVLVAFGEVLTQKTAAPFIIGLSIASFVIMALGLWWFYKQAKNRESL